MKKKYILDTNVLLDDLNVISVLRNGDENDIYIPYSVLVELDRLKGKVEKSYLIFPVLDVLKTTDYIQYIRNPNEKYDTDKTYDETIIRDIIYFKDNEKFDEDLIVVTNDKIFGLKLDSLGIKNQVYKASIPFQSDSEKYSGFDDELSIKNSFKMVDDQLIYEATGNPVNKRAVWGIYPKDEYQTAAIELILDKHIDIVTLQSPAGKGKTVLSLAIALELLLGKQDLTQSEEDYENLSKTKKKRLEKKSDTSKPSRKLKSQYKKIYVFRPTTVIGNELGFLPGDLKEKLDPYFRPIKDLLLKLHDKRPCNRIFVDANDLKKGFDDKIIEFLPITYLRGMNIDDAIVIFDEAQNLSRQESKTLLSRMGNNVKCIVTGDTNQIDNPYVNKTNNGLNWIVRLFKNNPNYGHIILQGEFSRGPITDLVLKTGL